MAKSKAAASALRGVLKPGFYEVEGKTVFVGSSNWFKEDCPLGGLVNDLLLNVLGLDIYLIESDNQLAEDDDSQRFIIGLWLGFFSETILKRSRTKQNYELGRSCAQALQAREAFKSYPGLGQGALVKDNFFFGNNAREVDSNGNPVPYYLKVRLAMIIKDDQELNGFLGVLNYAASKLRLTNLSAEEEMRCLEYNLISFDEVCSKHFKPKTATIRGKLQVVGTQKPTEPKSSPVFLKEENELISKLFSFHWKDLDPIKESWSSLVFEQGFSKVCTDISAIYSERWQSLQRYAAFTTRRLNKVRGSNPDKARTRKAQITREMILQYVQGLPNPSEKLREELFYLLRPEERKLSIETATRKEYDETEISMVFLYECFKCYQSVDMKSEAELTVFPHDTPEGEEFDLREKDIKNAFSSVKELQAARLILTRLTGTRKMSKAVKFIDQLTTHLELLYLCIKSIKGLSSEQVEMIMYRLGLPIKVIVDATKATATIRTESNKAIRVLDGKFRSLTSSDADKQEYEESKKALEKLLKQIEGLADREVKL